MRNILITGGSRGIGAACVELFRKNGDNVFFLYNKSDEKAEKIREKTGAIPIKCDISSFSEVRAAADIIHKTAEIDIIINNAGISQIKMFQDISENDWDRMFNVNIKGMFIVSQVFLSDMIKKKKGRIINISSMWGETGGSCEVHYSASKSAVIGFTKALAKELGPSNITVNCVSPGVIDTEMNSHLSDEDLKALEYETPVERIGTSNEIAEAVLYLADDNAGFVTGIVLPVNGGIVM